jgi:hypothetical protein
MTHGFFKSSNCDRCRYRRQVLAKKIEAQLAWLLLDAPSRYAIDVWRTVWLSVVLMGVFYGLYLLEWTIYGPLMRIWKGFQGCPWRTVRMVHVFSLPKRQRTFRLRLFEPIHSPSKEKTRLYVPWRDAALLSIRAFLKLGLGSIYPKSGPLRFLTALEWAVGAFMLIHFLLAVKNNLPFVVPFLGVVH